MPAIRKSTQPATEAHTVSERMLLDKLRVCRQTLWRYVQLGHIYPPRRRVGIRGRWWTPTQANTLMKLVGCQANPFPDN